MSVCVLWWLFFVVAHLAEAAVAMCIFLYCRIEVCRTEVGPICLCEVKFAVGTLSQKEVAESLFSSRTDDEVRVGDAAGVKG